MNEITPTFMKSELIDIQKRAKDSGLLMDLVPVNLSFKDSMEIRNNLDERNMSGTWLKLGLLATSLLNSGKIDKLSILDLLEGRLEPYPYQLQVALNVLKQKSSIALLADEVGLGKTIEVGLILKEHIVRENVQSVLIVTPKALILQWKDEMKEKFDEDFNSSEDDDFDFSGDKIIISFNKLARNSEKLIDRQWDMIIVDEAHQLINTNSKRRQAVASLERRYMLLSTATPLCNKLTDLYSLVDLLYPGLLGSERTFKQKFFKDKAGRVCKEDMKDELKKIVSNVMVRTLRKDSGIPFTERHILSIVVNTTQDEDTLFSLVTNYMRKIYNKASSFGDTKQQNNYLLLKELMVLQQSMSSSPRALLKSLENRANKYPDEVSDIERIVDAVNKMDNYSKECRLIETLNSIPNEKAIIFTLRLETAYMLSDSLNENYMPARVYEGRLSGFERQSLIEEFRTGKLQYIVATDSAAEGLNLQNASVIINYDLHWNPMKIEQRIGRVHRRGQEKDVKVINLVMKDTIDDYVLKVLYEKIELFKMTVGGIEAILSDVKDGDFDIEETIISLMMTANSKRDIKNELEKLSEDMEYKRLQNKLREEFSSGVLD